MRKLGPEETKDFALRSADDPRTARAQFAVELGGAVVWRTLDSRCHAVVSPKEPGEVHLVGTGEVGDVMQFLTPMPLDTQVYMSRHMYAKLASMVVPRTTVDIEVYAGTPGISPTRVPPPRTDFDVRHVLYSDLNLLDRLPPDATFLFNAYGNPRNVLARSAAFGAFNGVKVASIATADLGRTFASIWCYTLLDHRSKGLATHCVASLLDHLRPTGERPLFTIRAENGSPERAMCRRFEMELVGEMAMVERRFLAL